MRRLAPVLLLACSSGDPLSRVPDPPVTPSTASDDDHPPGDPYVPVPSDPGGPAPGDDARPPGPDDDPGPIDIGDTDRPPEGGDDAILVSFRLPATIGCNDTMIGAVTLRNSGTTTWTPEAEYYLGMPDAPDIFSYWNVNNRVGIYDGRAIAPGETTTFFFKMVAPAIGGTYRARYRMVHENVAWFGDEVARDVVVRCTGQPAPCGDIPDWRGNDEVQCPPTTATFLPDIDEAIGYVEATVPQAFDFNDGLGSLSYKIVEMDFYMNGVIARLRSRGLCAFVDPHDPNEIAIKRTNDFNDQIRIVRSGNYARWGNGAYMATCEPSWF
jgi:hypothetical protein